MHINKNKYEINPPKNKTHNYLSFKKKPTFPHS